MIIEEGFSLLFFLLIFNFIGAVAFGVGLRGVVRRQWMLLPPFFLVWGAGFGGIPLLIGAATFLGGGMPQFFVIQVTVVALTIIALVFVPVELLEVISAGRMWRAVAGSVITMIGAFILAVNLKGALRVEQIIAFVIIAIGIALLGTGMLTVLRQDA